MKIKRRKLHCFLNCFLFIQRGGQKVSKVAIGLLVIGWTFAFVSLFVAVAQKISWLDYLYYFSYIKLGVTLVKYIPQVQLSHLTPPNAYYLLTLISFQTWLEKCRPNYFLVPMKFKREMFIRCDFPTKESKCMRTGENSQNNILLYNFFSPFILALWSFAFSWKIFRVLYSESNLAWCVFSPHVWIFTCVKVIWESLEICIQRGKESHDGLEWYEGE